MSRAFNSIFSRQKNFQEFNLSMVGYISMAYNFFATNLFSNQISFAKI